MKPQMPLVTEAMEASKIMLETGANNPITVRLFAGDKTVAYTSSCLVDEDDLQNFVELLRFFTTSYEEIDGACLSSVAEIGEQKHPNSAPEKTRMAVIGAFRGRDGKNIALVQEFNIVANEVFFGEIAAVKGNHNFCRFLDVAFAK